MNWEDRYAVGWCKFCGKRLRKMSVSKDLTCKKCSRARAEGLPPRQPKMHPLGEWEQKALKPDHRMHR
jgi:tRNA(Ile2) C34 agmatinyltransferase TiaS